MSRIRNTFNKDYALFIPFFMAGHPTLESTVQTIINFSNAGADIIELGIPFSDPIADGPINQNAAEIALKNGVTLDWCLEQVKKARGQKCDVPIILFTYLNPIMAMGVENFAKKARAYGVDGVLIVDLPPEAGEGIYGVLADNGLDIILLVSPTSDVERLELYKKMNPGFIYYISRLGITGVQGKLSENLAQEVNELRKHIENIPIAVGFGISSLEQAQKVAEIADGVIIGSYLVNEINNAGVEAGTLLAKKLSAAISLKDKRNFD